MTIKLKPLVHYPDSNSVEATWVDEVITPAVGTEGEEGYVPASVVETQVRCHSYAAVQMDMLRADLGEIDYLLYQDLIATVVTNIQPAVVLPLTVSDFESALDNHLNKVAQAHRWDNRITFALRAGYPNRWQAQAVAFGEWMDRCNAISYDLFTNVMTGQVPAPTSIEAHLAMLPILVLPEIV